MMGPRHYGLQMPDVMDMENNTYILSNTHWTMVDTPDARLKFCPERVKRSESDMSFGLASTVKVSGQEEGVNSGLGLGEIRLDICRLVISEWGDSSGLDQDSPIQYKEGRPLGSVPHIIPSDPSDERLPIFAFQTHIPTDAHIWT